MPNRSDISLATDILRSGGLVAVPTETVYGLGADATNADAVRRIFEVKGRPGTNPLIIHVADAEVAKRYVAEWPDAAQKLAERFWPGPLTLVLPKQDVIVDEATAGRKTVAVRVPDHPLALEMLRRFDGPVAAPSANRSTRVSPTTAQHVRDELGDKVDLILDGGPCQVGIESTVLDLSTSPPAILRPGSITREQIEQVVGPVSVFSGAVAADTPAASPGQHELHYAPRAAAYRFEAKDRPAVEALAEHIARPTAVLFLGSHNVPRAGGARRITMPQDAESYARLLYRMLRGLDDGGVEAIWIEMPPDGPEWTAVRDRLTRATKPLRLM